MTYFGIEGVIAKVIQGSMKRGILYVKAFVLTLCFTKAFKFSSFACQTDR